MRTGFAEMRGLHHGRERRLDRPLRVGQKGGDACERLVRLGIEDMKDGADEKRVTGFLPMVPLFQRALGVDEDVGDILNVADLPLAAPNLQQRVVGVRPRVGRVEEQHPAVLTAKASRQCPILALDVVDDGGARPGQ